MREIIGIINQKGGVSKTSTALALWSGLPKLKNLKTLCIDLDPQCNLTVSSGAKMDSATILDVLLEKIPLQNAVQHTNKVFLFMLLKQKSRRITRILLMNYGRVNYEKKLSGSERKSGFKLYKPNERE